MSTHISLLTKSYSPSKMRGNNEKTNIERRANNKKTLANIHGIRGDLMIITMNRRKKAWVQVQVGPLFETH